MLPIWEMFSNRAAKLFQERGRAGLPRPGRSIPGERADLGGDAGDSAGLDAVRDRGRAGSAAAIGRRSLDDGSTEPEDEASENEASYVCYRMAIEHMPYAHIIFDADGVIRTFNSTAERSFSYARSEAIGMRISKLIPDGGINLLATPEGKVYGLRKDGSEFPMSIHIEMFVTDEGVYFNGIFRDISDELEVEAHNRRLRQVVEQASDAILVLKVDGRIEYANPTFEREFGVALSDIVGRRIAEMEWAESGEDTYHAQRETVLSGKVWTGHVQSRSTDGNLLEHDVTTSPVFDEKGRITHSVQIRRNISERLQLEMQLNQALKLESIGRLAAGIAHEINTPSQYVGDNIRFLQDAFREIGHVFERLHNLVSENTEAVRTKEILRLMEDVDLSLLQDDITESIEQSLSGLNHVGRIVRSMKEYSHPAKEKRAVDLNRVIDTAITVSTNEWKYVAEIEKNFDPHLPPVFCLPDEVNQVILNLIVNAAHAIEEARQARTHDPMGSPRNRGTISIATKIVDGFAQISVADTGAGMEKSVISKIFDPFFTTKSVGRGTGQGLSMAHAVIVEKHGGTISVDSEVGNGSCFTIRLPLKENWPSKVTAAA